MMSALYKINTLNWIFIVLFHWNSPRVDMSYHSDISARFRANQSVFLLLNVACLAEKQQTCDVTFQSDSISIAAPDSDWQGHFFFLIKLLHMRLTGLSEMFLPVDTEEVFIFFGTRYEIQSGQLIGQYILLLLLQKNFAEMWSLIGIVNQKTHCPIYFIYLGLLGWKLTSHLFHL